MGGILAKLDLENKSADEKTLLGTTVISEFLETVYLLVLIHAVWSYSTTVYGRVVMTVLVLWHWQMLNVIQYRLLTKSEPPKKIGGCLACCVFVCILFPFDGGPEGQSRKQVLVLQSLDVLTSIAQIPIAGTLSITGTVAKNKLAKDPVFMVMLLFFSFMIMVEGTMYHCGARPPPTEAQLDAMVRDNVKDKSVKALKQIMININKMRSWQGQTGGFSEDDMEGSEEELMERIIAEGAKFRADAAKAKAEAKAKAPDSKCPWGLWIGGIASISVLFFLWSLSGFHWGASVVVAVLDVIASIWKQWTIVKLGSSAAVGIADAFDA